MPFKTIHTTYGLQRMAAAEAAGIPINLTHMAVGDGNGNAVEPTEGQTQLVREMFRATVNRVFQDPDLPTKFTAELVVPATEGGFTLREVGIFDADGGLFAVGNLPPSYKPNISEGAYDDTVVRLEFLVTNAAVVTLQIDPNVAVATQTWITNNVTAAFMLPGGTTHQVLRKASNADGDTEWADPTQVNVTVSTIEEEQTLAVDQTQIDLTLTNTTGLAVYIEGVRLPKRAGADGWEPDGSVITRLHLGKSYPDGTHVIAVQNEPASDLPDALLQGQNLADVPDKDVARTNLNVFSKLEASMLGKTPGEVFYTARSTAPPGSLKANGAAVNRVVYADLFAAIGTTYGAGDGFATFNLPDLRGEFIRGWDDSRGVDANRSLGSGQAGSISSHSHGATADAHGGHVHGGRTDAQGGHSHTGNTSTVGDHTHANNVFDRMLRAPYPGSLTGTDTTGSGSEQAVGTFDSAQMLPAGAHSHTLEVNAAGTHSHGLSIDAAGAHSHNITVAATGGSETRPRNVALLACIKY